jgi:Flp pilus assembly pilin Flp
MSLLDRKSKIILRRARGQGITEYGAVLAFVAILVALCFSIANGKLGTAVCGAFSSAANQLNVLSTASGSASS